MLLPGMCRWSLGCGNLKRLSTSRFVRLSRLSDRWGEIFEAPRCPAESQISREILQITVARFATSLACPDRVSEFVFTRKVVTERANCDRAHSARKDKSVKEVVEEKCNLYRQRQVREEADSAKHNESLPFSNPWSECYDRLYTCYRLRALPNKCFRLTL